MEVFKKIALTAMLFVFLPTPSQADSSTIVSTGLQGTTYPILASGACSIEPVNQQDLLQSSPSSTAVRSFGSVNGSCSAPLVINYKRASSANTTVVVTQISGAPAALSVNTSSQKSQTLANGPVVLATLPGGNPTASLVICSPQPDFSKEDSSTSAVFMINELNADNQLVSNPAKCAVSSDVGVQGGGCSLIVKESL